MNSTVLEWRMIKTTELNRLPDDCGVFIISVQDIDYHNSFVALYVGSAQNLKEKITTVLTGKNNYLKMRNSIDNKVVKISYTETKSMDDAKRIESFLINYYRPMYSRIKKIANNDTIIVNRPNVKKWTKSKF